MKITALIPARDGSGKNLWLLHGLPLVSYPIALATALLKTNIVNRIIVSSDSDKILQLAPSADESWILDRRPSEYSQGTGPIHRWIQDYLFPAYGTPDILLLLQPTSPFCTFSHASACVNILLTNTKYNSAQTVQKVPHNFHMQNRRVSLPSGQIIFEHRSRSWLKKEKDIWRSIRREEIILYPSMNRTGSLGILRWTPIEYPAFIC